MMVGRQSIVTVASGEFWVGSRGPVQLEAYLGTCVGLAVFDAATGLPLFLKALQDKGGDPMRMKACLAGGALIGPIAQQDLNLDIGGRISDITVAFLAREGIDLVQFETGGIMPTRLGLDMASGRFSIAPAGSEAMPKERTLVFLGRNLFTRSVVAVCVQDFYCQQNSGYSLRTGGLYQHAVGTALIAEHLARRTHRLFPALAYTGGLLHDIGKVVLDQFVAARRPLFYRDLADLIMSRFHAGLELESINTEHLAQRLARLGLSSGDLQSIIDGLPSRVFRLSLAGADEDA